MSGWRWKLERFENILPRSHIRFEIILDTFIFQILLNPSQLRIDPFDALLLNPFHNFDINFGIFLKYFRTFSFTDLSMIDYHTLLVSFSILLASFSASEIVLERFASFFINL